MLYSEMTDKITNLFYKVYNILGYGFLEKVYENSLAIELKSAGFKVLQQQGKYQKHKPQIRVNPRNPRHPRSIRLDEYYFLNP